MPRKTLRAVEPDERLEPKRKLTVIEAAETGDPREILIAMRDHTARLIGDTSTPSYAQAALMRSLKESVREITAMDHAEKAEAERGGHAEDEAFDASAI